MIKLLLADDAPDIRLLLRVMFSVDKQFEIVGEAETPRSAIEMAKEFQPDVAIVDQGFRGDMTGLEAAPLMKAAAPAMKIVLFTAYHDAHELANGSDVIDAFLLKTDVQEIASTVRNLAPVD